jgi:hypothetical protein
LWPEAGVDILDSTMAAAQEEPTEESDHKNQGGYDDRFGKSKFIPNNTAFLSDLFHLTFFVRFHAARSHSGIYDNIIRVAGSLGCRIPGTGRGVGCDQRSG